MPTMPTPAIPLSAIRAAFAAHGEAIVSVQLDNTVYTGEGVFARTWVLDSKCPHTSWTDQVGSRIYLSDGE